MYQTGITARTYGLCPGPQKPFYQFRSKKMQEQFMRFRDDPDRLDMRNELALARMVLDATVRQLKSDSPDTMTPEERAVLLTIVKDVGDVTEQMARVQRYHSENVTIEHVRVVCDQLITIMNKHVPWQLMEKIIHEFDNLNLPERRLKDAEVDPEDAGAAVGRDAYGVDAEEDTEEASSEAEDEAE